MKPDKPQKDPRNKVSYLWSDSFANQPLGKREIPILICLGLAFLTGLLSTYLDSGPGLGTRRYSINGIYAFISFIVYYWVYLKVFRRR